jgi:hypothetical protein
MVWSAVDEVDVLVERLFKGRRRDGKCIEVDWVAGAAAWRGKRGETAVLTRRPVLAWRRRLR